MWNGCPLDRTGLVQPRLLPITALAHCLVDAKLEFSQVHQKDCDWSPPSSHLMAEEETLPNAPIIRVHFSFTHYSFRWRCQERLAQSAFTKTKALRNILQLKRILIKECSNLFRIGHTGLKRLHKRCHGGAVLSDATAGATWLHWPVLWLVP